MKKRKETRTNRARTWLAMAGCAFLLVCGFFFAARQHFSSMDVGMKNSRLRKQIDDLESEKRRLLLAREVSLSPAEIKKAAVKTRLSESSAGASVELASATPRDKVPSAMPGAVTASLVTRTASVAPAIQKAVATGAQKSGAERPRTVDKKLVARVTNAAE